MKTKRELELYVHIPFCVRKCAYCDFLSAPAGRQQQKDYVDALIREIERCGENFRQYRVSTVFLGGGTPSILEGDDTVRLLLAVKNCFELSKDAEITMEVNPGTVTEEKAEAWRKAGINRLSIGLQSVEDRELEMLGRIHTYAQFLHTWDTVRSAGFENVNVDLISAIPGQTAESWEKTLRTVAELSPEHISAYSLIIEEGTLFYEKYGEEGDMQAVPLPDEDEERVIYETTESVLEEYGYHRYEISNYAREGYECRHNKGYWERKEYLGLGLGSASLIEECRFSNTGDMEEYMEVFREGADGFAWGEKEKLSERDRMEEFFFLGLREMRGISEEDFLARFHVPLRERYGEKIDSLVEKGLLEERDGRIALTKRGIDISNYVFVELLEDEL